MEVLTGQSTSASRGANSLCCRGISWRTTIGHSEYCLRELRPHSWGGFLETSSIPWTRSRVVKAVSPRIAVLSVIRVPECLQVYRTEESRQRQLERGAEPGSDEVRGVNHNLEEEVAKECYIQTRVSGYPTETDGPRPV